MGPASESERPDPGLLHILWQQMGSGRGTPSPEVVQYALGALHALQDTGQIDEKRAAIWHRRFKPQRGEPAVAPRRSPGESESVLEAEAAGIGETYEEEPAGDSFDESSFIMSIAGPAGPVDMNSGRLRITSLEMYVEGILVHWLFKLAPHLRESSRVYRAPFTANDERRRATDLLFEAIPHFKISDSLGTRYTEARSNWTGEMTLHGESRFHPGLPRSVTALDLAGAGWHVSLDVPRIDGLLS